MSASIILLLAVGAGWTQATAHACCKCESSGSSSESSDAVCLSAKETRGHVNHVEPLQPSGLGKGLNLAGTVIVEIRFEPDGKVACVRARSGHPIAISAAMVALPKWTFKPVVLNGAAKGGCGRTTIKYRLHDQGSSTEIQ